MNNICSAVGGKGSLFDGVVKLVGVFDFLELELRVVFIRRRQEHRTHADNAVDEISAELDINHAEHIEVINLAPNTPSPYSIRSGLTS